MGSGAKNSADKTDSRIDFFDFSVLHDAIKIGKVTLHSMMHAKRT